MQKFILLRGLPGSGKSTIAKSLRDDDTWEHIEADMYFMIDGEYRFDQTKLHHAHEWCMQYTKDCLSLELNIIVSNTFTTVKEIRPYLDLAKYFKIKPQILTCHGNFGSIHGVPDEALKRMSDRWVSTEQILKDYNEN